MPETRNRRFYGPDGAVAPADTAVLVIEQIRSWIEIGDGKMHFPTRWRAWPTSDPIRIVRFKSADEVGAWLRLNAAQPTRTIRQTVDQRQEAGGLD